MWDSQLEDAGGVPVDGFGAGSPDVFELRNWSRSALRRLVRPLRAFFLPPTVILSQARNWFAAPYRLPLFSSLTSVERWKAAARC